MWDKPKREAECGMKMLLWEQDLLILAGRMWNSFKIDGEMQENRKSHITDVTWTTANSNKVRLR